LLLRCGLARLGVNRVASRRDLLHYVLELRRNRDVGVLWATHLVDEAESADRVVVLHKGKVLEEGAPAALVAKSGKADLAQAFLALTGDGAPAGPPV